MMVIYSSLLGGEDRIGVLENSVLKDYLLGQYNGYCDELGLQSKTETLAMVTIFNNTFKNLNLFVCGKGMNEKKTQIRIKYKKEFYKNVIEKTLVLNHNDERVRLDSILNVELVIDILNNSVYLEVYIDTSNGSSSEDVHDSVEKKVFVLMSKSDILKMSRELVGELDDHALIFDGLINNKKFATTSIKEGYLEWKIFGNIKYENMIFYDKGVSMPKEGVEFMDRAYDEHYK